MVIITAVQNATTSGMRVAVKFTLREEEKEIDRKGKRDVRTTFSWLSVKFN